MWNVWNVLSLIDEAAAVSSRMMSLFQTPPTVHFALLDGTPNDIKGAWTKICGDAFQWLPSNSVLPQVWLVAMLVTMFIQCICYGLGSRNS